jgi:hypothetical protein
MWLLRIAMEERKKAGDEKKLRVWCREQAASIKDG